MRARGLRLNNPGLLRHGDAWLGRASEQPDPDFVAFATPEYGLRALVKTLTTYQRRHGLRTLRELVTRWAPPSENDTTAYLRAVARALDRDADAPVDVRSPRDARALIEAIVRHENGQQPYDAATIREGLRLAGITA